MSDILLEVRDLKQHFPLKGGLFQPKRVVKAVDGISFAIKKGETLGLVGESGCGKSTAGRSILQLYRPTSGQVLFRGEDITKKQGEDMRKIRRKLQMIFQDPYASLNPRMTVGSIIAEPIETHNLEPDPRKQQLNVAGLIPAIYGANACEGTTTRQAEQTSRFRMSDYTVCDSFPGVSRGASPADCCHSSVGQPAAKSLR